MKIGVNVINFGPSVAPKVLRTWAEVVQELGYHYLFTSDHVTITQDVQERFPAPFYEPLTTLGWLAAITTKIKIGTSVLILPYRSPLQIARAFANLDTLSGGRCILGVGVGWSTQEYAALNVNFTKRGEIADEYLSAILKHWTEDVTSFEGKYVTYANVQTAPSPVSNPYPPIWVGGGSLAAIRRAVRYGNAWHPYKITAEKLENEGIPLIKKIADRAKRRVPEICPRISLRFTKTEIPESSRLTGEGSLQQIKDDLLRLKMMGCSSVTLDPHTADNAAIQIPSIAWEYLTQFAENVYDFNRESIR